MKPLIVLTMSLLTVICSLLDCKNNSEKFSENTSITVRYFLNNSALHKQKSDKGVYLYDEISKEDAQKHEDERAYFIGFYRNDTLVGYQKIFRGEVLLESGETEIK